MKTEKRGFSIRLIEYAVRFLLGFILSGARVFGTLSPFAVGFVAASSSDAAVITLMGAVSGYLFFGSFLWSIQYISAAVLVCTILVTFRDTHVSESAWFMPMSAAVITTCVGFVSAAGARWAPSVTVLLITDIVLAGGCAYFFRRALNPWKSSPKYEYNSETINAVSVLILLSAILISLSNITVLGVMSIGRTLAALSVFLAAYTGGVGMGCATGVAIGLAMDAASGGPPLFSAAYGFAGLTSGVFSKRNRLSFAASFILVGAAISLMSFGSAHIPAVLYEAFAASVIFIILPSSFMSRFGALLPNSGRSGSGVLRAREYTKARIDSTAIAFKDLYTTVKEKTGIDRNDEDLSAIFDRAAETTCRKCGKSSVCWQTNYQTTLDVMNNLSPMMLERGQLSAADFPDYFWCVNLDGYVTSVNTELRGLLYRRQYKNRLRENQNAAFNQYSDVSSILSEISVELSGGIKLEPELEERLSKYLQSLGFFAETAVFRVRSGRLIAEIVDSGAVRALKKDPAYLDKLSVALGVRLCTDETLAASDRLKLLEAEPLSAAVGISCVKKSGQEVSGDKGAYFKTDDGILYVILSDGMGSGEFAARYSGDTIRILERFLCAGVKAETAVRMLNDLFLLKNEDDTGCATIDLVSIDLFSGKTNMFKYGAAPSYLRHDGVIRRVRGKSLAVGLGTPPHNTPDHVKMALQPGSIAVMVSDGVISGTGDSWLEDIISDFEVGKNPRKLSKTIIDQAFKKSDKDDDMTVIAIQVGLRE
ncbi:MAG: SpoIIE family protein phosphatase [Oscillospiraceae bacterium]|nr:SpoIIE family protein phosphatase [Oscillospiraceae bacterium]